MRNYLYGLAALLVACGGGGTAAPETGGSGGGGNNGGGAVVWADNYPAAGNPDGHCSVPTEAAAEDITNPRTTIGDGTPASCTGAAVIAAVAKGGVITLIVASTRSPLR